MEKKKPLLYSKSMNVSHEKNLSIRSQTLKNMHCMNPFIWSWRRGNANWKSCTSGWIRIGVRVSIVLMAKGNWYIKIKNSKKQWAGNCQTYTKWIEFLWEDNDGAQEPRLIAKAGIRRHKPAVRPNTLAIRRLLILIPSGQKPILLCGHCRVLGKEESLRTPSGKCKLLALIIRNDPTHIPTQWKVSIIHHIVKILNS